MKPYYSASKKILDFLSILSENSFMQTLSGKKEVLHQKTLLLVKEFKGTIPENFIYRLEDMMFDFVAEANRIDEIKVERREIQELIIELREDFRRMDQRFEALQVQLDKRFEQMDKRFESMQIQMDQRFDDMNKRFNSTQWLIGLGFIMLGTLMSVFQIFGR